MSKENCVFCKEEAEVVYTIDFTDYEDFGTVCAFSLKEDANSYLEKVTKKVGRDSRYRYSVDSLIINHSCKKVFGLTKR